jgi:hypothetical protein
VWVNGMSAAQSCIQARQRIVHGADGGWGWAMQGQNWADESGERMHAAHHQSNNGGGSTGSQLEPAALIIMGGVVCVYGEQRGRLTWPE